MYWSIIASDLGYKYAKFFYKMQKKEWKKHTNKNGKYLLTILSQERKRVKDHFMEKEKTPRRKSREDKVLISEAIRFKAKITMKSS